MFTCSGLGPNYVKLPYAWELFLNVWSGLTSAYITVGIVRFCINYATNINLLVKGLGPFVSFSSAFLKVCLLTFHQKDLQKLNEGISTNFGRDLENPELQPHLLAHFRLFSKCFYAYAYAVLINVCIYAVLPLLLLKHGKYLRMFPVVVPVRHEPGDLIHFIHYGVEMVCGFQLWPITIAGDSIFGLHVLQIAGELRVLSYRFKNLKLDENYRENLKECVNRHVTLMQSYHTLERIFGLMVIWLGITCAVCLCALTFDAFETKHMSVWKVCYLICYSSLKLLQAYNYALYGNIINVEVQCKLGEIR